MKERYRQQEFQRRGAKQPAELAWRRGVAHYVPVINAFIEDTCVLVVIAYLLARGGALALLFPTRPSLRNEAVLGLLLGLVGLTEIIFPGARSPYVLHALIVTFATLVGGLRVGFIAATVVTLAASVLQTPPALAATALTLYGSAGCAEIIRCCFGARYPLLRSLAAGASAPAGVALMRQISFGMEYPPHFLPLALFSIPANGFGVLLLQLVLNDARARADSERNRLEAERAHALAGEAQLAALRARIHPHFLFNALTSIAALCRIAPEKAESAILRLSQLMRRVLAAHPSAPIPLAEEMEYVRDFLAIEQERMGARLRVLWEIEPGTENALVPTFALQTLVENAVLHGVAPKIGPGEIRITARLCAGCVLIAARDDGEGVTAEARRAALQATAEPPRGLQITRQQLVLLYGPGARPRLFRRKTGGTLAAFAVPLSSPALTNRKKSVALQAKDDSEKERRFTGETGEQ